ncbi:MAG: hypothetical protein ACREFX_04720 [Opitutaceae bacterium]
MAPVGTEALAIRAIARWLAGGVRSTTHPLLNHALRRYFSPLGIDADWLEAEPFGALECGSAECWLRNPRWNPEKVDPARPDAAPLRARALQAAETRVDPGGILHFPPHADNDPWPAVRLSVNAASSAAHFIHAAAALLFVDERAAALYAAGDDTAFIALVHGHLCAEPDVISGPKEIRREAAMREIPEADEPPAGTTASGI